MRQHDIGGLGSAGRLVLLAAAVATALALFPTLSGCARSDDPAYYIAMLGHDKEDIRRRGSEELKRMQRKALPALKEALKESNVNTRTEAIKVLANLRTLDSLAAVGEMINDPEQGVRVEAIAAVAKLSPVWKTRSVVLLTEAFEQTDPACVKKAAEGLRDMRYSGATDVLWESFDSKEGIQSLYAAKLLYEAEARPDIARHILEGLASSDMDIREAASVNVIGPPDDKGRTAGLKDKFVEPMVHFIDTAEKTGYVMKVLWTVRDALVEDLDRTLDSKLAAKMLHALGTIADRESADKLLIDFEDHRLETVWRVSSAQGLSTAANSARCPEALKSEIIQNLTATMDDEGADSRIRIGAAIALCKLRRENGVQYLLDELDRFQETVVTGGRVSKGWLGRAFATILGGEMTKTVKISPARLRDLTRLRIAAQEALTESGDFVVDYLMARIRDGKAGPIIVWAAAKTLGELKMADVVPLLRQYLIDKKDEPTVAPDGRLIAGVDPEDWEDPDEETTAALREQVEEFRHPDYVRWTAAITLGQIGGEEAISILSEAEADEQDFVDRVAKNEEHADFYKREAVVADLMLSHKDVLYYIGKALQSAAGG